MGIVLLAPSYLPLYFQNRDLERVLSIQKKVEQRMNMTGIDSTIARILGAITSLRQSKDTSSGALDVLNLLTAQRPGVVISSFSVDAKGKIVITGRAVTRNDLLLFEQHLRDSSRFQDIAAPLANIIKETDINFNFMGTLKKQYAL